MKTTRTTATTKSTTPANDNAPARAKVAPDPAMTVLRMALPAMQGAVSSPVARWALAGWAAHLRDAKHPIHAANSWAKHAGEFGAARSQAGALTAARLIDFGLRPDEASALMKAREAARSAKAA